MYIDERIYSERKMVVGVAIGGPLAGGYYFWRTLNALGKPRAAAIAAAAFTTIFAIAIGSVLIPWLDRVPNVIFYGLQLGLVYGITRGYLLTEMTKHIAEGKAVFGWGNTTLVAAISLVITVGLLIAFVYLGPGFDHKVTRTYGTLKHEIIFDPENISEQEVAAIASALTSTGYFDKEMQKTVDAAKSVDRFILTVYCNDQAREPAAIDFYKGWRDELQKSFPTNRIVIDMVVETADNRIARLE